MYFKKLIAGMQHMHNYGVYHLDLKPDNIFLNENLDLKIVPDFSF